MRSRRLTWISRFVVFLFLPLFVSSSLILASLDLLERKLILDFRKSINILAPYISDQEEEEILSSWSLMKNEADYRDIYLYLQSTAKNIDVDLEENSWLDYQAGQ